MDKKPIENAETYCLICTKQFKSESSFNKHMRYQHRSKTIHECVLCEDSFARVEQLIDHILEHNKNKLRPFGCHLCGTVFEDVKSLEGHVVKHIGADIVQQHRTEFHDCSECSEHFTTLYNLCIHRRDLHTEQKYQCGQCELKFTRSEDLHTHRRIHRGLSILKCFCEKLFASPKYLAAHIRRLHPGEVDDSILLILDEEVPVDFSKVRDTSDLLPANETLIEAKGGDGTLYVRKHKCPFCSLIFVKEATVGIHIKRCHSNLPITFEKCNLCEAADFRTRECLMEHYKTVHDALKPFKCTLCELRFIKIRTLLDHVNATHQNEKFRCEYCGLQLQRQTSLQKHYKKHESLNDEPVFLCNTCQIPYVDKKCLLKHMRVHQDGLPHKCNYCEKKFATSCDRQKHERIHTGEKPYRCESCSKTFTHWTSWKKHEVVHTKERNWICPTCGKAFQHKSNLKVHTRIHTGDRPFSCDICAKTFVTSGHLTDHLKIHSGIRDFKCDLCGKTFTHQSSYQKHKVMHSGVKPHVCQVCNRAFSQAGHFRQHVRQHSGEMPHACPICKKVFRRLDSMKNHLAVHEKPNGPQVLRVETFMPSAGATGNFQYYKV